MVASYNGWSAAPGGAGLNVQKLVVNGVEIAGGVRGGPVYTVMRYVAEQFAARVEPLVDPGCWGGYYKMSANSATLLSCHSSWTAFDLNAPRHPNGRRGTFTKDQVSEIRKILDECDGVVYWGGGGWNGGTVDEMHFEIATGVTESQVRAVADRLGGNTPLQKDGFLMALNDTQQTELYNHVKDLVNVVSVKDQPYNKWDVVMRFIDDNESLIKDTHLRVRGTAPEGDMLQLIYALCLNLSAGGGDVDVNVLAEKLKSGLGDAVAKALGEKLAS